ncbi:hypothetical protein [Flavonifractor hominis]|uniref:Uncharacterized protein n=1 Tax=Flavonifractor hominis TaxID=3133178 RepID=A0ABV1ES46_9FIRM
MAYDDTDHPQTPEWLHTWTKTHLQFQIRMFGESLPPDEADADSRPDDPSAGERL